MYFIAQVRNALADAGKKDGIEDTSQAMFTYLIDRVRANLHVVVGMSPVGEVFRSDRARYDSCQEIETLILRNHEIVYRW